MNCTVGNKLQNRQQSLAYHSVGCQLGRQKFFGEWFRNGQGFRFGAEGTGSLLPLILHGCALELTHQCPGAPCIRQPLPNKSFLPNVCSCRVLLLTVLISSVSSQILSMILFRGIFDWLCRTSLFPMAALRSPTSQDWLPLFVFRTNMSYRMLSSCPKDGGHFALEDGIIQEPACCLLVFPVVVGVFLWAGQRTLQQRRWGTG